MIRYKEAEKYLIWLLSLFFMAGCGDAGEGPKPGKWRGCLSIPAGEVPFNFELESVGNRTSITLINAEERFGIEDITVKEDSIFIKMPVYENEIIARITGDTSMSGLFRKLAGKQAIEVPFTANWGQEYRFLPGPFKPEFDFSGTWKVGFTRKDGSIRPAIGLFRQNDRRLSGTFLTASGDYRYLEGVVYADNMLLSAFDGNSVYLFQARIQSDSSIGGYFYSGTTTEEPWVAIRDSTFKLPDADTISQAIEDREPELSLTSTEGKNIVLSDYRGKVVILQILGSWCPNCLDESRFLVEWYAENQPRGAEIIGIAFEKTTDREVANKRIKRLIDRFGVTYPIAFAGEPGNETSDKVLDFISPIRAYPTTVFLDKAGKVRKVHTGFNGPGTGIYFDEYKFDFNKFVDQLLAE